MGSMGSMGHGDMALTAPWLAIGLRTPWPILDKMRTASRSDLSIGMFDKAWFYRTQWPGSGERDSTMLAYVGSTLAKIFL